MTLRYENGREAANQPVADSAPALDPLTRQRLGRHLKALYEPVIDEPLDPRLAELMRQLDADRQGYQDPSGDPGASAHA